MSQKRLYVIESLTLVSLLSRRIVAKYAAIFYIIAAVRSSYAGSELMT
jgi:hypothetical protein